MADRVGRPLKFETPEELEMKINNYFDSLAVNDIPTITGLAVYLDTSRETLREYKGRDEYVDSIKKALDRCQAALETRAILGGTNATFSIFTLKNNYGWVDKTEQDITTGGEKIESRSADIDTLTQFMMVMKDDTKQ